MKTRFALIILIAAASLALYTLFLEPEGGKTLRLFTWDTYASRPVFDRFTDETGIRVIATSYSSNDAMLAELEKGTRFDLVTPSVEYVTYLSKKDMLKRLPRDKGVLLQNRLAPAVRYALYDPEGKWSVPLFYGTTGIAVNTTLTAEQPSSWKQLFTRPADEAPSIGMLDEKNTLWAVAALATGVNTCDITPGTLARLKGLFDGQKPFVKSYKSEGYYDRLAAGEVAMQLAWSGDAYIARRKNADIRYFYPEEGLDLWVDSLAIPSNARNTEAAMKFMEFVTRPDIMAQYAAATGNIPAVADAMPLLPQEMRDAPEFNMPPNAKISFAGTCTKEQKAGFETILKDILK